MIMAKVIKLNIPASSDREKMLVALGNSGIKVWVEVKEKNEGRSRYYLDYFLCFEVSQNGN